MLIWPEHYRNLARGMIAEKRPTWYLPVSVVWLLLIVLTWFKYYQSQTLPTLLISLVLSMSLIKPYAFTFRYAGFRSFAFNFLNCPNDVIRVFALIYIALGGVFSP